MGVGIFLLAALVLLAGYTIMNSNLIKALIVAVYTVIVLIVFQIKGLVDWEAGIVIALSQGLGGWLTAKYANNSIYVEKIAYALLVIIVLQLFIGAFIGENELYFMIVGVFSELCETAGIMAIFVLFRSKYRGLYSNIEQVGPGMEIQPVAPLIHAKLPEGYAVDLGRLGPEVPLVVVLQEVDLVEQVNVE